MRLQGRVETPYFDSKLLKGNLPGDPSDRMVPVYLPPDYDESNQRYPSIYVLSGHGGSGPQMVHRPDLWTESFPERLDRLIVSGKVPPVIAVLPDCFTIFGGAQFINSSALGPYEDYLIEEIIPFVDANYRTKAERDHRGLTGKSSGGYGAMVQGMRHPEIFGALASHSGDIYFEFGLMPDLAKFHRYLQKLGGLEKFIEDIPAFKPKSHDPFYSVLAMLCYGAAYAPNPKAPRGFDLPVNIETGELREDVWARWLAWDPVRMIDKPENTAALRKMRYIYLDCGLWDELNFAVGTRIMSKKLDAAGIRHDMELFPDGHLSVSHRFDISLPKLVDAISD